MSRKMLRPSFVLLALFAVVLVKTSSFVPNVLQADDPPELCDDVAAVLSAADTELAQQEQLLTSLVADEQAAAIAYINCEAATPGQCGAEQSDWQLALDLVQLGNDAVADALSELTSAQSLFDWCQQNCGGDDEEEDGEEDEEDGDEEDEEDEEEEE